MEIKLPRKIQWLFAPDHGKLRWRGAYGGRGSGKSFNFAKAALVRGVQKKRRLLCTRDIQASIKESFYAELKAAILSEPFLTSFYRMTEHGIYGNNGTEFMFRGLRHNIQSIKSMAQIDICIVEEAQDVSEAAWRKLIPTIRAPGSEIWSIWNPTNETDAVDVRLRKEPPARCRTVEVNWSDNPWFPPELNEERLHDLKWQHPNTYAHIWEGAYLLNSEAQVLADKISVEAFEPGPDWHGAYHGLDFGFSQDPTFATKSYVFNGSLYIRQEASKVGLELDDTAEFLKEKIPGIDRHEVIADSARPESISYLKRKGLSRIKPCKKWAGSVVDGIAYLRSYKKIIIHPDCPQTLREGRLYSFKVDRLSGQVLDTIIDAHNHSWDSVRYAHDKIIRQNRPAVTKVGTV